MTSVEITAKEILRKMKEVYEDFHNTLISEEIIDYIKVINSYPVNKKTDDDKTLFIAVCDKVLPPAVYNRRWANA